MSVYTVTNPTNYGNLTLGAAGAATSGQVITVANGTGASTWSNQAKMTAQGELHIEGDNADIVINGVRLSETLKAITERLSILQVDPKLHSKYDNLRQAYEHYKTLEALLHEESKGQ